MVIDGLRKSDHHLVGVTDTATATKDKMIFGIPVLGYDNTPGESPRCSTVRHGGWFETIQ